MKQSSVLLAVGLGCLVFLPMAGAQEFYVSPTGDDTADGSLAAPFATLERARDAIRAVSRGVSPAVVWLHGGNYVRTNSFELSAADTNCVYQAVPGETPRFIGGQILDPAWFALVSSNSPVWSRLAPAAQGNLLEVDLGAHGLTDYGTLKPCGFGTTAVAAMELFVNSRPQQLGRWPNDGSFATVGGAVSSSQFTYSGTEPSRWSAAEEVWLHGYFYWLWADFARAATNINLATKTISLASPPWTYGIRGGQPYFALNLVEEIDVPGEYYIQRNTGRLYVWPPTGFADAEIVVSMLGTPLINVTGSHDLVVDGLELLASRGHLVQINDGANVRFSHCRLLGAGAEAASIDGMSNGLDHCEIADCGGAGVLLGGGDRYTLIPGDNYVRQCLIHDFSRLTLTVAPGVFLSGVGQTVEHCEIYGASHCAIMFGGNEHHIEYNHIHDVCRWSSDAGAIYCGRDWGLRGNQLRDNFIHDVSTGFGGTDVHAIYNDDCASGLTMFGNVCYRIAGIALVNGGGRDNDWENNVVARCGTFHHGDARGLTSINNLPGDSWNLLEKVQTYDYQNPPWSTDYPALAAIPNDYSQLDPYKPPGGTIFSRNIGWQNTTSYGQQSSAFSYYAEMTNNVTGQDPLFVNEATLDLTLQTNSPAFNIPGFQPIPFREIGLNIMLTWDADPGDPAPQDGDGVWVAGSSNWWGIANQTWDAAAPGHAIFGATTGSGIHTVMLAGNVTVTGLTFSNQFYTIVPDTANLYSLTLAGTSIIEAVADGAISARINGRGNFTKAGSGTLLLSGTNACSGNTILLGGTLAIGVTDALPTTRALIMGDRSGNAGALDLSNYSQTANQLTVLTTDPAKTNLIKIGNGQTLTVANQITIGDGSSQSRLLLDNSGIANLGNSVMTARVYNNAALILGGPGNITLTCSTLGIADNVIFYNPGTLSLAAAGTNILYADTIFVGGNGHNSSGGKGSGTLQFSGAGTGTLTIRNAAGSGSANLNIVTSDNGNGLVTGILDVSGHAAELSLGTVTMADHEGGSFYVGDRTATLSFDRGTLTAAGVVMGIRKISNGTSTATLNIGGGAVTIGGMSLAQSTVAGGTATAIINLTGGNVTLNGDMTCGGGAGTSGATLTLDGATLDMAGHNIGGVNPMTINAQSGTLNNVGQINNGGSLTKIGAGTLTLGGSHTYTGSTIISGGTLRVNGSLAGALTAGVDGTLAGTGTIRGPVTVNGTLSPGASVGTVTISNDLVLAGSAVLYELGNAGDLTTVCGNLTIAGTLNITATDGFGVGSYMLFSYNGTLTDNGLAVGTTPDPSLLYAIDTATPGLVKLVVTYTPLIAWQLQYFGCSACPAAAADADPDGDGINNAAEFATGTNPTDSASAFRIDQLTRDTNGHYTLTWSSIGGKRYRTQYSDGGTGGGFNGAFTDIVRDASSETDPNLPGTPGTMTFIDDFVLTGGQPPAGSRYYRVRLMP